MFLKIYYGLLLVSFVKNILAFKVLDLQDGDKDGYQSTSAASNFISYRQLDQLYDGNLMMMDEVKNSNQYRKNPAKSLQITGSLNAHSQNTFNGLTGITSVIQRMQPKKRDIMKSEEEEEQKDMKQKTKKLIEKTINSKDESEEFDSDEHIENSNDWHDELDVVKMPHLLGPSATKYSPVPLEYQHYSTLTAPPFSCQQILVQFTESGPSFSLAPCPFQPYYNYAYNTQTMTYNQY